MTDRDRRSRDSQTGSGAIIGVVLAMVVVMAVIASRSTGTRRWSLLVPVSAGQRPARRAKGA
jgi:hypothetical protein